MKHASSRELFAYWTARRGTRAAPERGEIEPSAIRRSLGDTFILAFDRDVGHHFRLAGTRVCTLVGHELRGTSFADLWDGGSARSVMELLSVVSDEMTGIVAGAVGSTPEGWSQELELLVLPLRHRGNGQARMIGALAPLTAPFWLGSSRLDAITLGNTRHLDPAYEAPAAARLVAAARPDGRRPFLTVYEGGRR